MLNRKNRFLFLALILVFLSTSGYSSSICSVQNNPKSESVLKKTSSGTNDELLSIQDALPSSIRVNENYHPTFDTSKNSKKDFRYNSFLKSFIFSTSCYISYRSDRINRVNACPFYIIYRRLTV